MGLAFANFEQPLMVPVIMFTCSQQPTSMIIVSALYNNRRLFIEDCQVIHFSIKQ